MGQKAHFGDISYHVFNRRKSSYFMQEILYFTIFCRIDYFQETNQQIFMIVIYIHTIYKNLFVKIWCYSSSIPYKNTFNLFWL